jgi:hypothetical protein
MTVVSSYKASPDGPRFITDFLAALCRASDDLKHRLCNQFNLFENLSTSDIEGPFLKESGFSISFKSQSLIGEATTLNSFLLSLPSANQ